jgi:hypothetical protein
MQKIFITGKPMARYCRRFAEVAKEWAKSVLATERTEFTEKKALSSLRSPLALPQGTPVLAYGARECVASPRN